MSPAANAPPTSRTARLLAAVLAAGLVLAIVPPIVALAGLGVLSADLDLARIPGWFWYYRGDPQVRAWLGAGLGAAGSLLALVGALLTLNRRPPLHGAARWAGSAEVRRAGLRAREGIVLGRTGCGFLVSGGDEHVMLYAPTRTGKGVGVVIPNLLTWPHSVVVLDIKRENFTASGGYRAERGQRVLMFDPLALDGRTARYNPLGHVDREDPAAVLDELQRMAAMLFPGHDHADPFWSEAARTGFIGVGAFVAASPPLPFTLGEIYRQLTEDDPRRRFPAAMEARRQAGRPLPRACAVALQDFCGAGENTFASIRQSITSRMGLWLNPAVDAATSASDFDLREVRQGRLSLYLGTTPDNLLRVAPLYSLLFQQLVDLNSRALPQSADRPVLVLLDEFARLGPAPVLAHAFSWVAGYGLRLLPVIQSPAQLRGIYGPDLTEAILTNCAVEAVFAPRDLKTAQDLSERIGAYTYGAQSRSRPQGLGLGRRSLTVSDQRRPLMLPQELMQMPSSQMLVFKAGVPAVRARKITWYRDHAFRARLRPPPEIEQAPPPPSPASPPAEPLAAPEASYEDILRAFAAEGLPAPARGASEREVADWLDRVMAVNAAQEPRP